MSVNTVVEVAGGVDPWTTVVTDYGSDVYLQHVGDQSESLQISNNSSFRGTDDIASDLNQDQVYSIAKFNDEYDTLRVYEGEAVRVTGPLRSTAHPSYEQGWANDLTFVLPSVHVDTDNARPVSGTLVVNGRSWRINQLPVVDINAPLRVELLAGVDVQNVVVTFGEQSGGLAYARLEDVASLVGADASADVSLSLNYDADISLGLNDPDNRATVDALNLLPAASGSIEIQLLELRTGQQLIPGATRGSARLSMTGDTRNVGFVVSPEPIATDIFPVYFSESGLPNRVIQHSPSVDIYDNNGEITYAGTSIKGSLNAKTGVLSLQSNHYVGFEVSEFESALYDYAKAEATDVTLYAGFNHEVGLEISLPSPNSTIQIDSRVDIDGPRGGGAPTDRHQIVLAASTVEINAPVRSYQGFAVDLAANAPLGVGTEEVVINSPLTTPFADIYVTDRADTSTPNRSQVRIGSTGSITNDNDYFLTGGLNTPGDPDLAARVYLLAETGDIIIDGKIAAEQHTYVMQSAGDDNSRFKAPFVLSTGSFADAVGRIIGNDVVVSLGNDIYGSQLTTTAFSRVSIDTDVERLRVRAGSRRGDETGTPFPYELSVREVDDLTLDAVAASSRSLDIFARGGLTVSGAIRSGGDVSLGSNSRVWGRAPLETSFGTIDIEAPEVNLSGAVRVLDTIPDERRTDISIRATDDDFDDAGAPRASLYVGDEISAVNNVELTSELGSVSGIGLVTADTLLATAADNIILHTNVHRAKVEIQTPVITLPGQTGIIALYEEDYIAVDARNARTVVLSAQGDDAFLEDPRYPEDGHQLSSALIARVSDAQKLYASAPSGSVDVSIVASTDVQLGNLDDAEITTIKQTNPLFQLDTMLAAGSVSIVGEDAKAIRLYDAPNALSGAIKARFATQREIRSVNNAGKADSVHWIAGQPGFDRVELEFTLPVKEVMELVGYIRGNTDDVQLTGEFLDHWNQDFRESDIILVKDGGVLVTDGGVVESDEDASKEIIENKINGVYQVVKRTYKNVIGTNEPLMTVRLVRLQSRDETSEVSRTHYVKVAEFGDTPASEWVSWQGVSFAAPDTTLSESYTNIVVREIDSRPGFTPVTTATTLPIAGSYESRFKASSISVATATAEISPDGKVAKVEVDDNGGGVDYPRSSSVTVTFDPPPGPGGKAAVGYALTDINGKVSRVVVTDSGSGYSAEPEEAPKVYIEPPHYGKITSRLEQAISEASELFGGVVLKQGDLVLVQFGTDQDQNPGSLASARTNGIYQVHSVGRNQNAFGLNGAQWELVRYRGIDENGDGQIDEVFTGVAAVNQGRLRTSLTGKMFEYSYDAINTGDIEYTEIVNGQFLEDEGTPRYKYYTTSVDSGIEGAGIDLTVTAASGGNNDGGTMGRMLNLLQQNKTDRPMQLSFDVNLIRRNSGGSQAVVRLTEELPAITRAVAINGNSVIVDGSGIVADEDGQELRGLSGGRYFGPVRPSEVVLARRQVLTRAPGVGSTAGDGTNGLEFGANADGSIVRNLRIGGFEEGSAVFVKGADNILFENMVVGGGATEFAAIGKRLTNMYGVTVDSYGVKTGYGVTLRDVSVNDATAVGIELLSGTQGVRILESTVGSEGYRNEVGIRVGDVLAENKETPAGEYLHQVIGVAGDPNARSLSDEAVALFREPKVVGEVEQWLVEVDSGLVTAGLQPGLVAYDAASGRIWTVKSVVSESALATASATVNLDGTIEGINLGRAGDGYEPGASVPVTVAAPEQIAAKATAIVNAEGKVSEIVVTAKGQGYLPGDKPAVMIAAPGANGIQATATAEFKSDGTLEITLKESGSRYPLNAAVQVTIGPPPVTRLNENEQATATASVDEEGRISKITLENKGSGYWPTPPVITIAAPEIQADSSEVFALLELQDGGPGNFGDDFVNWTASLQFGALMKLTEGSDVVTLPYGGLDFRNVFLGQEVSLSDRSAFATDPTVRLLLHDQASFTASLNLDQASFDAILDVNGAIESVHVTHGGAGSYKPTSEIPLVFSAPEVDGGEVAEGFATVDGDGAIKSVTVTNAGSGYENPPTVTYDGYSITDDVTVTYGGAGYPSLNQALFAASLAASGAIEAVEVTDGGAGYKPNTEIPVVFSAPEGDGGEVAQGFATVDTNGAIKSVTVTSQGSGYESVPTLATLSAHNTVPVTFTAPENSWGEVAIGEAIVDGNGTVFAIKVTNPGSGYENPPSRILPLPTPKIELSEPAARSGWVFATFEVPDGRNDVAFNQTGIVLEGPAVRLLQTDVRESLGVGILIEDVQVWDAKKVSSTVAGQPVIEIGGQGVTAERTWGEPDRRNVAVFANRGAGIVLTQDVFEAVGKAILDDFDKAEDLSPKDRDELRSKFSEYVLIAGNYLGKDVSGAEELANGTGIVRNIGVGSLAGKAAAFASAIFNGVEGTNDVREDHDIDLNELEKERPLLPEDFVSMERYRALFRPEDFEASTDVFTFDPEIGELDPRTLLDRAKISDLESIRELDSLSNRHGTVPKYQAGDNNPDDPVGGGGGGNGSGDGDDRNDWWNDFPILR